MSYMHVFRWVYKFILLRTGWHLGWLWRIGPHAVAVREGRAPR